MERHLIAGHGREETCPPWSVMRHQVADEDDVHVGAALMVRRTVLRLCTGADGFGAADGPYVLVGSEEFTLDEAEALIAGFTQLVDGARESLAAQGSEGALPVRDV